MLLWSAACVVHEEFKYQALLDMKEVYPAAGVLVHPESPAAVIDIADCVGSTSQILKAASDLPHDMFIVATDRGLFHQLRKHEPSKRFVEAPTAGRRRNVQELRSLSLDGDERVEDVARRHCELG